MIQRSFQADDEVVEVNQFCYLGSQIKEDGLADEYFNRIQNARPPFRMPWKESSCLPVLLCGCETKKMSCKGGSSHQLKGGRL